MHGYNRLSRTKCSAARYAIWVIDSSLRLQHNSYNQQRIKLWCLFIQFPKATSYLGLQDLPCVDYVRMQKRQLRLSAGQVWGSFLAHWQYLHTRPVCAVRCDHRLPHCLRKSKVIKELGVRNWWKIKDLPPNEPALTRLCKWKATTTLTCPTRINLFL